MRNLFKSSKVKGFNRIVLGFLLLTLEHLNPLNLERAFAQTNYYAGKTITVCCPILAGASRNLGSSPILRPCQETRDSLLLPVRELPTVSVNRDNYLEETCLSLA